MKGGNKAATQKVRILGPATEVEDGEMENTVNNRYDGIMEVDQYLLGVCMLASTA